MDLHPYSLDVLVLPRLLKLGYALFDRRHVLFLIAPDDRRSAFCVLYSVSTRTWCVHRSVGTPIAACSSHLIGSPPTAPFASVSRLPRSQLAAPL